MATQSGLSRLAFMAKIGKGLDDPQDIQLQKSLLVVGSLMFIAAGAVWGVVYILFQEPAARVPVYAERPGQYQGERGDGNLVFRGDQSIGSVESDFEKGEAQGSLAALGLIDRAAMSSATGGHIVALLQQGFG